MPLAFGIDPSVLVGVLSEPVYPLWPLVENCVIQSESGGLTYKHTCCLIGPIPISHGAHQVDNEDAKNQQLAVLLHLQHLLATAVLVIYCKLRSMGTCI
jgi:hypothetical protein